MSDSIQRAYEHCAEITRRRARNFYYGLRLTPEPKRSAIYSVYAWMRGADDQVDSAGSIADKQRHLAVFAETTGRLIKGQLLGDAEGDPVWVAFRETIDRYGVDRGDLRTVLSGLKLDLEHEAQAAGRGDGQPAMICASRKELEEYCFAVASTVGLMCITIWGLRAGADREQARELAVKRGLAFQLTNVLRDFAEDYDQGRVYVAGEDFEASGVGARELREWADAGRCAGLVSSVANWARRQYDESAALDELLDPECLPAMKTMTRIYSGLLGMIEREPRRIVGSRRIRLQSARKASIAITSIVEGWLPGRAGAAASRSA